MKAYRVISFSIRQGMRSYPLFWCAPLLFGLAAGAFETSFGTAAEASLADVILFCFRGMEPVNLENPDEFRIPMLWIALILWCSLSVTGKAEECTGYGQQIFLRSGDRRLWWLSQCCWNAVTTLTYYMLGFVTLLGCALAKGWRITGFCVFRLVAPIILGTVCWNLLQMYIAMYTGTVISVFVTCTMLISSIYINSPFLMGNYWMAMRCSPVMEGGVEPSAGCLISCAMAGVAIFAGMEHSRRMDYIRKETQ